MGRACLASLFLAAFFAAFSQTVFANAPPGHCVYGHWKQMKPGCHMKKLTLPRGGVRYIWMFERDREWMYVFNPYEPRRWTARYPTKYNDECDQPQVAAEIYPEDADPCQAEWKAAPAGPLKARDANRQMVPVTPPNPRDLPEGI